VFCPGCGSNNQDEVKFCTRCGSNLEIVSDAMRGRTTAQLETDERMVTLLKDYYRSRRMTLIGGIGSVIALFKLALLLLFGFPEKLLPLTVLLFGLLVFGLFALIWGIIKWNNSSSEIKALGVPTPKAKSPRNRAALVEERTSLTDRAQQTDPMSIPASVTEATTHFLEESRTGLENQSKKTI
jgi:hypothetical protein